MPYGKLFVSFLSILLLNSFSDIAYSSEKCDLKKTMEKMPSLFGFTNDGITEQGRIDLLEKLNGIEAGKAGQEFPKMEESFKDGECDFKIEMFINDAALKKGMLGAPREDLPIFGFPDSPPLKNGNG